MAHLLDRLLSTLDVQLHAFAVCEVRAGWRLVFDPMDAAIIHYVLAGTGSLQTNGGVAVPFGAHSILIVPPGRRQSLGRPSGPLRDAPAAENCSMVADGLVKFDAGDVSVSGEILTACATVVATYGGGFGLFDSLSDPIVENIATLESVRNAFRTMAQELASPGIGTRALTESLMKRCMILLLRQHLGRQGVDSPLFAALQDQRLARAVAAILERPSAPHRLDDLAEIAGMSRSAFAERFSETFGQSPLEFVQSVRLRQAAQLLSATVLPVSVVASSVGYASRSHFSRAFHAAYGADPSTYRAEHPPGDMPILPARAPPLEAEPGSG